MIEKITEIGNYTIDIYFTLGKYVPNSGLFSKLLFIGFKCQTCTCLFILILIYICRIGKFLQLYIYLFTVAK